MVGRPVRPVRPSRKKESLPSVTNSAKKNVHVRPSRLSMVRPSRPSVPSVHVRPSRPSLTNSARKNVHVHQKPCADQRCEEECLECHTLEILGETRARLTQTGTSFLLRFRNGPVAAVAGHELTSCGATAVRSPRPAGLCQSLESKRPFDGGPKSSQSRGNQMGFGGYSGGIRMKLGVIR